MATPRKRDNFSGSEQGKSIREILEHMAGDVGYNTESSYNANSVQYPDNIVSFVDKHMNYLDVHPKMDATTYIANLRMMTRVR